MRIYNPPIFFFFWTLILNIISTIYFGIPITSANLIFYFLLAILSIPFIFIFPRTVSSFDFKISMDRVRRYFYITLCFWIISQLIVIIPSLSTFDLSNPEYTKNLATQSFLDTEGQSFSGSGKGLMSILNTGLFILGFPSIVLGSILLVYRYLIGVTPLLFGMASSFMSFSRFHFFIFLIIFIYTFFLTRTLFLKKRIKVKNLIYSLIVLSAFFVVPALLRSGDKDVSIFHVIMIYIFGGIGAFNIWFNNNIILIGDFNGTSFYTLKTWLSYAKLASPPKNLHYEFIELDSSSYTNVFSLFRSVLEDFGLFIFFILILLALILSSIFYYKVVYLGKIKFLPLLSFFFCFFLFTFYTSLFSDFRIFLGSFFSTIILRNQIIKT